MFTQSDWWIGVEHEFFLLTDLGTPPCRAAVIAYFHLLAKHANYNLFPSRDGGVARISKENKTGYSNIKYDQEPCLLEFSTSKHPNIESLHAELSETFTLLDMCASEMNLKVVHTSILDIDPSHPSVTSDIPRWGDLRNFRVECAKRHGRTITTGTANYGAVMAATQIQISGKNLDWFENPSIISSLYKLEPLFIRLNNSGDELAKRWKYYFEVFGGFPLIGAPVWDDWTIENWITGLNNSPFFEDPYVSDEISSTCLRVVALDRVTTKGRQSGFG